MHVVVRSEYDTAGADTFTDRKNEAAKCCDTSFDLRSDGKNKFRETG